MLPPPGRTPWRDHQQGSSVRQAYGDGRSFFGQADPANPGQVLAVNEGPIEGDIEIPTPARNP